MKVLLGMSGGVDSSYAAALLKQQGYEVEGAILRMHPYSEVEKAKRTADALGIPLHIVDCQDAFYERIVLDFCDEYRKGRTPNPCIRCNAEIKLRFLWETAKSLGFDKIATGHYARVVRRRGRYAIAKGIDARKDQSYFLYRVTQDILENLLLPLGELEKNEVQRQADSLALEAAKEKESQEICFIQGEKYTDYIERACGKCQEGNFVDDAGRVLGRHKGIIHYTVGQRKGLGVSASSRLFVRQIDPETNTVYLSDKKEEKSSFYIDDVIFSGATSALDLTQATQLTVKIRYLAKPVLVSLSSEGNRRYRVHSAEGFSGLTPGQSAVIYDGECVLAGGFINLS